MKFRYIGMLRITALAISSILAFVVSHDEERSFDKFRTFFEVVEKLLDHDKELASLRAHLEDTKSLDGTQNRKSTDTSFSRYDAGTYTRWGRSSCPNNATLVYDGYAAGSWYIAKGAAVNYLCLPKNPDWDNHTETPYNTAFVYGAEYQTRDSVLHSLHDHEVPCAVCRVQSTNIIMVPGKNTCNVKYRLEYNGYLMAGYPSHNAASEYVCVDAEAKRAQKTSVTDHNGALFYFVHAKCGSLKCPPYKEGQDLTCVVCSFAP